MMVRGPRNIGMIPEWYATRNRRTRIVVDQPFMTAPWLGTDFDVADYARAVDHVASRLTALGLGPGGTVAVVRENHLEIQLLAAAAARIGALPAMLSADTTALEQAEMLHSLQPDLVLATRRVLARWREEPKGMQELTCPVVVLDADPAHNLGRGLFTWVDVHPRAAVAVAPVADDQPMLITHTSGTTGVPKLVVHTARTLWSGTRVELLPIPGGFSRRDDVFLSSIPFAHSRAFTWVTAQFYWGPREMVAVGDYSRRTLRRMLEAHRPTIMESLPNVLQYWKPLVSEAPELFQQVRLYINTFDAVHAAIAEPFVMASRHRGVMWVHSWGQSEVGPIAAGIFSKGSFRRAARAGRELQMGHLGIPWPGLVRLRVADAASGGPVPAGERGLLQVRSSSIAVDYRGNSQHYRNKWAGPWWNTGDFGYQDRWGRVFFQDRSVDRLQEESAVELESVLLERFPECDEVVVLPNGDQPPIPVLCLPPEVPLDPQRWQRATQDLGLLSDPVVMGLENVPRTSTWKVKRTALREHIDAIDPTTTARLDRRFI